MHDELAALVEGISTSIAVDAAKASGNQVALTVAEKNAITIEITQDALTAIDVWHNLKSGQAAYGSVELINLIASEIEAKLADKYGINIPLSEITNLAGSVVGVYLYGFSTNN